MLESNSEEGLIGPLTLLAYLILILFAYLIRTPLGLLRLLFEDRIIVLWSAIGSLYYYVKVGEASTGITSHPMLMLLSSIQTELQYLWKFSRFN